MKEIKISQVVQNDIMQSLGNQKLKDFIDKPISELFVVLRPLMSLGGFSNATMSEEPELQAKIKELEKEIQELKEIKK